MNGERRRLLGVERAKPDVAVPGLPLQAYVCAYDTDDVGGCLDFLGEVHAAVGCLALSHKLRLVEHLDANVLVHDDAARVMALQGERAGVKLAERKVLAATIGKRL